MVAKGQQGVTKEEEEEREGESREERFARP
jgi:hypothetical protein